MGLSPTVLEQHFLAPALCICLLVTSTGLAQSSGQTVSGATGMDYRHAIDIGAGASLSDRGAGALGYRVQLLDSLRLGVDVRWTHLHTDTQDTSIAIDGHGIIVRTPVLLRMSSFGRLRIDLVLAPGIRHLEPRDRDTASTTAITLNGGAFLHWRLLSSFSVRAGVSVPFSLTVAPITRLSQFGVSGHMGTSIRVTDWCWAYADGMVSVIDGAGNHSKRVAIEGQFGLRFYFDSDGPDHDVLAPLPGSW